MITNGYRGLSAFFKIILQLYCYDVTEKSTCLSNVPERSRMCVAYMLVDAFASLLNAASRADYVKMCIRDSCL